MLHSVKDLDGFRMVARGEDREGGESGEEVGKVREVYFDDERWVIRYLVVATGGWLSGRNVLVSLNSITGLDRQRRLLETSLTKAEVEDAPGMSTNAPVPRQREAAIDDYDRYPPWWAGAGVGSEAALPPLAPTLAPPLEAPLEAPLEPPYRPEGAPAPDQHAQATRDPHLRSSAEVIGCRVVASDGDCGHLADLLFDDRSWQLRHAVVDTRDGLGVDDRLVAIGALERPSWDDRKAFFRVPREAIASAPSFDPTTRFAEDIDERLARHYGRWLGA